MVYDESQWLMQPKHMVATRNEFMSLVVVVGHLP